MSKDTVIAAPIPEEGTRVGLTDLPGEGAKRLIAEAADAELSATLAQFSDGTPIVADEQGVEDGLINRSAA